MHDSGGESAGQMVDYYNNHWLWTPLCEAVASLNYRADADERDRWHRGAALYGQVLGTTVEAPGIEQGAACPLSKMKSGRVDSPALRVLKPSKCTWRP